MKPSVWWTASRALSAVLFTVYLSGCAAQRPVLDDSVLNQLTPNTSSGDVWGVLGRPSFIHTLNEGGRSLGYVRRCPDNPTTEPCKSAPEYAHWQVCEIKFAQTDRYSGLACSWAASP